MPAKISLIQNLASWRYDTDGKLFCVDVNPKDILPHWQFDVFFGQISDNLKVAGQSVGLASPSIKKKVMVSLPIPILDNGNSNPVSGIDSEFHKEHGFGLKCLAISGDVELGRQPSDTISLLQPCIPYKGSHNLNVETSPIFGGMADLVMEIPHVFASFTLGENKIEFGECLSVELCEYPSLSCSGFYLQKYSTFHSLDQKYLARKIYKDYANNSTIHPTHKWCGLPCRG